MTERASATRTTELTSTVAPVSARPSRAAAARLDPALTRLQRSHGNRYVQRVVATSRAASAAGSLTSAALAGTVPSAPGELSVGAANDTFEHEADRTADQVMRSIGSHAAPPPPHRCGSGCVQRHAGPSGTPAAEVGTAGGALTGGLSASITATRGGGAPLPDGVRSSMESAFGADFSAVRVHAGSDLTGRVASTAFTLGRDIHFAPGAYRPCTRSGQWLLAHELTHVVQQGGNGGRQQVQRHSSKEHYLLGSLTPEQIRNIAQARVTNKEIEKSVFGKAKRKGNRALKDDIREALHVLDEQITALDHWRIATVDHPSNDQHVEPAGGDYQRYWGGQLVTLTCRDGQLVCTLGDLNALPDFFGSVDDIARVSRSIVFRTLQVIRRESYIYLKTLQAELKGKSYAYNAEKEAFKGLEYNTISVSSALPESLDALKDLDDTEKMLAGRTGEVGLPVEIGAKATLGRNACHFPPESWLRWLDHHRRARAMIARVSTLDALGKVANDATVLNAFGEHYLQDSFAGGHLINKSFVMAEALTHLSKATAYSRGITPEIIDEFRRATAHEQAYDLPQTARNRVLGVEGPNSSLDDPKATTARDPQSAMESAQAVTRRRRGFARGLIGKNDPAERAKQLEVEAMGLNPKIVDFDTYRTWLNDVYLQKATNSLHNKFCVEGLKVSSPAVEEVFRVYGDANMIRSVRGAHETALASRMSQQAINALVHNRRMDLADLPGPRRDVVSEHDIIERFPNRVHSKGHTMSLRDWATGASMSKLVKEAVHEVVSTVVRGGSLFINVSGGLSPDHGPF